MNTIQQLVSSTFVSMNALGKIIVHNGINLKIKRKSIVPKTNDENIPYCYFLKSGSLSIIRNNQTIIIETVDPPVCLCIGRLFGNDNDYIHKAESEIELYAIDIETLRKKIDEEKVWFHVSIILSYQMEVILHRDYMLFGKNAYNIIRVLLQQLISRPEQYRNRTGVAQFILQRSTLSRSSVMKILHELKKGGYIETIHGKLISIRTLPDNF